MFSGQVVSNFMIKSRTLKLGAAVGQKVRSDCMIEKLQWMD